LLLVICCTELAFVFINIPGSFVAVLGIPTPQPGSADRRFCGPRLFRTAYARTADRKIGGPRYPV
jgi:hypothetical protein